MAGKLIGIAGMIVVLGALALSPSAQGRGDSWATKVAKDKDGPYGVVTKASVPNGDSKTLWWRVTSKADSDLNVAFVDDTGGTPGFKVKWFKGDDNVSSDVNEFGYEFVLHPDQSKYFRGVVTRTRQNADPVCIEAGAHNLLIFEFAFAGINIRCEP